MLIPLLACLSYVRLNTGVMNILLSARSVSANERRSTAPFRFILKRKLGDVVVDPIAILVVLAIGFAAGYSVREWKSRKRRRRHHAERNEVAGVFGS
jgi:hypothetical protein